MLKVKAPKGKINEKSLKSYTRVLHLKLYPLISIRELERTLNF